MSKIDAPKKYSSLYPKVVGRPPKWNNQLPAEPSDVKRQVEVSRSYSTSESGTHSAIETQRGPQPRRGFWYRTLIGWWFRQRSPQYPAPVDLESEHKIAGSAWVTVASSFKQQPQGSRPADRQIIFQTTPLTGQTSRPRTKKLTRRRAPGALDLTAWRSGRLPTGSELHPVPNATGREVLVNLPTHIPGREDREGSPRETERPTTPGWETWLRETAYNITSLVTIDKYSVCLGRGGFGEVFKGLHSSKGQVALKRPHVDPQPYSTKPLMAYINEIDVWARAKHDHILEFLGVCLINGHLHLVSPYIENGNLFDYIKVHPEMDRIRAFVETADAIAYLHSLGIVHGDIKAKNILVGTSEEVKVCDFGLSILLGAETSTLSRLKGAGSPRWMAPELFQNEPKSFETDIYAFGITVAEVLQEKVPFSEVNDYAVISMVGFQGIRPELRPVESGGGQSYALPWKVAQLCWRHDPATRISMIDARKALMAGRSGA